MGLRLKRYAPWTTNVVAGWWVAMLVPMRLKVSWATIIKVNPLPPITSARTHRTGLDKNRLDFIRGKAQAKEQITSCQIAFVMCQCILVYKYTILVLFFLLSGCAPKTLVTKQFQPAKTLNLPVTETRAYFVPYKAFCRRNPGECDLSGQEIIQMTPDTWKKLLDINTKVNHEIELYMDESQYQKEEFWAYPSLGLGDCEDIALEKRFRLVNMGIPRGALRIAIGYHKKKLHSHAVLTVETRQGTLVLDSTNDQILIWHQTPYNFEMRERPDGRWERYDQEMWTFN
ncbi:MAG: transglutaminase-like cysteine peptidase [Desulfobacteraceae bacterium]|jgi:predicted transglutaminase-like cysteine proteinase